MKKFTKEEIATALKDLGVYPFQNEHIQKTDYHDEVYSLIDRLSESYEVDNVRSLIKCLAVNLDEYSDEPFYMSDPYQAGPQGVGFLHLCRFEHQPIPLRLPNDAEGLKKAGELARKAFFDIHAYYIRNHMEIPTDPLIVETEQYYTFKLDGLYCAKVILYNANLPDCLRLNKFPSGMPILHWRFKEAGCETTQALDDAWNNHGFGHLGLDDPSVS